MPLAKIQFQKSLSITTLHRLLRSVASTGQISLLSRCHSLIITSGHTHDVFLINNLITFYSKSNSISFARQLFDHFPHKDTVTYNSLLSAYASHGKSEDSLSLFRFMLRSGMPTTALSFTSVLKACSLDPNLLVVGKGVHSVGFRVGVVGDALVSSSLVGLYSKFGLVDAARKVFDEMDQSCRDSVLWGIMMKAYCQLGLETDAILLFSEMRRDSMCDYDGGLISVFLAGVSSWNLELAKAIGIKGASWCIECFYGDEKIGRGV